MAKTKQISTKTASFAKGGSTKMFGKQHVGTQTPGQTATKPKGAGGKFAQGGKTKMFSDRESRPAKAR